MKLHGAGALAIPALAVAHYSGCEVETAPFTPGLTEHTAAFKGLSKDGKYPALELKDGVLIADADILEELAKPLPAAGNSGHSIKQWFNSSGELCQKVNAWLLAEPSQRSSLAEEIFSLLKPAEETLQGQAYLSGDAMAAPDVAYAAAMAGFYKAAFTPDVQAKFPKLKTFASSVYADDKLKAVWGSLECPAANANTTAEVEAFMTAVAPKWTTARTRAAFIEFFEVRKGHPFWPSSPVVPLNDPTLLFTNAGMNQYKAIFLGTADPATPLAQLTCAANTQKCIRAGGKHNDLDDVGKDVYHHTFFEMLGNWSFGKYFKDEAIAWAWELLTEIYHLPADRLYATYFEGDDGLGLPPDEEARELWRRFLPEERIIPGNKADNFWEMGDQGPCGPCTEIHYDRLGGRLVPELVNQDDPNVLEIWNVVFIQYNREAGGGLRDLPAKHVDTGMGLERVSSVLAGVLSNYATDAFAPLFDAIRSATGARPYTDKVGADDADGLDMAYRVVADHIRTLSFAIADGAAPGADGRDYVLRRVLRRAVRYGDKLGGKLGFFSELVGPLVAQMGPVFPELVAAEDHIRTVIREEETAFGKTLRRGAQYFLKKAADVPKGGTLDGAAVFELYDAFGYPVDLTELMAEELGINVDTAGFEKAMEEAKQRSRAAGRAASTDGLKFEAHATAWLRDNGVATTDDAPKFAVGEDTAATVRAIMTTDGFVDKLGGDGTDAEAAVGLVLDKTSFYAESGGQVTDTGCIKLQGGAELLVSACVVAASYVLHKGTLRGAVAVGDGAQCAVDWERRARIIPNHTMTHVLNCALREVLGPHVDQKGSVVLPEKLSFDFSNKAQVSPEQLEKVQRICRDCIAAAQPVYKQVVPLADAQRIHGLRAVFGEAYPDPVRVVSVGKAVDALLADPDNKENGAGSIEFCGGTHMDNTADAIDFAILSESAIAQGVRRIVAVTGDKAKQAFARAEEVAGRVSALEAQAEPEEAEVSGVKDGIDRDDGMPAPARAALKLRVEAIAVAVTKAKKARIAAAAAAAGEAAVVAADAAVEAGARFVVTRVALPASIAGKALPDTAGGIRKKHPNLACLLLAPDTDADRCPVFAEVPKAVTGELSASDWLKSALAVMGGKGGGKPVCAQGSGPDVSKVDEAEAAAVQFAKSKLAEA
eukprot:jgi/Ulvmu1/11865/UM081_0023.1